MKKEDLKTGMFGMMSNGKLFVIVNGYIVYQEGGFDYIDSLDDEMAFGDLYHIERVVKANSFLQCEEEKGNVLYNRSAKQTVMSIAEIEEKLGIKNLVIKGE